MSAELEQLKNDLRFPMADVRQILENCTVGDWKAVLIVGNGNGNSVLMAEEGVDSEVLVKMIEDSFGGEDDDG